MWGNAQGWGISAVMVLATAAMLYYLSLPPEVSKPAGLIPLAYKPVELPVKADTVAGPGAKDCDAGPLYRQAVEAYLKDPKPYQDAIHSDPAALVGVRLVLQARDCGRMLLFGQSPKEVINYDNEHPPLDALMALGQATDVVGLGLKLDKKPQEAQKHFEAAFVLGHHLFEERVCWREMVDGLSLMTEAAQSLAKLSDDAGDASRVRELRRFSDATLQYEQKLQEEVASPLANPVEQTYGGKYAGDVLDVASNPNVDRVWRVEAILHVGRYRLNVADGHRGDQLAAEGRLRQLEQQTGPNIVLQTAINAAEHLTSEQQSMTR